MVGDGSGSALLKAPAGLARIYLSTHGDLVKSALVAGDFNELAPEVVALESGLRWRRLDENAVAAVVSSSGAPGALGVPAERVVAAVLEAGRHEEELPVRLRPGRRGRPKCTRRPISTPPRPCCWSACARRCPKALRPR